MKKVSFWIFFFFFSTSTFSQVGGETVFQFLNLSSSSRQIALGGEVLTLMDDVNQPIWNPSVINPELDRQLSINYASYLAGISIGSASYAHVISRRFGTIHGSINYLNYGTLIEAGDIAVLYYSPYKPYSFTIVARNMGTQIQSFDGTNEKLPFKVAIGGSYKLKYVPLKWHVTLDNLQQWNLAVPNPSNQTSDLEGNVTEEKISFFTNAIRHIVVGAELFPESAINLRAGYNFRRASELKLQNARSFSGISFGIGIKMNKFRFNYAFSKYHSASSSSTFSLQFDLDKR